MGALDNRSWFRCFIVIVLVIGLIIPITSDTLFAYNIKAEHKVNQDLDMNAEKKAIWNHLRNMGFSEAATAGIMGNFMQESGCNRTVTQGHVSWSQFKKGKTGLGLAQWTSSGRQDNLFKVADELGKQWTDLEVQMKHFENEISKYDFDQVGGLDKFKQLTDVDKATVVFEDEYERAGKPNMSNRKKQAKKIFTSLTGTAVTDVSSSSTVNISASSAVVAEWDLIGMPSKSGILSDSEVVILPSYNELENNEKYSVSIIKEDLTQDIQYSFYEFIRVFVTFLGLFTIMYGVLLLVAYIFDRANNFIEVSLIGVLTLGKLKYSDEDEHQNKKGYVGKSRIIKISLACFVVGMILVTGGIFSGIIKLLYWFGDLGWFS